MARSATATAPSSLGAALGSGRRPKPRRRTELGLLALVVPITLAADVLASLGLHDRVPPHLDIVAAGSIALVLAAHLATRFLAPDADPIILPVATLLNGIGWVMVQRLDAPLALRQALWSTVGILVYIGVLGILRHSRDLERYRFLLAVAGAILFVLPLAPGIGETINGARLWVHLGPVSFQPVELAKVALVVFLASWLVEKRELLSRPTARIGRHLWPDPRPLGPVVVAWAFAMLAMTAEHNVGFALLIFTIFLAMVWTATGRLAYLGAGAVLFGLGSVVGYAILPQVSVRISIWLNPWAQANGAGFQIVRSLYALGTGGLTGTGLGLGHPNDVPVAVSDFIFAAIGNEMGLIGTVAVLVAYVLLVGSGFRIALSARNPFAKLVATGLSTTLGLEAFFIMAGVVRLLPLTGLALPFVAYGGSSLVANYLLLAILNRIADEAEPGAS